MCKKNNILLYCGLVFVLFGLVGALIPLADLDHDGCLESLVTEGLLSSLILHFAMALLALLTPILTNYLLDSQSFFVPPIPPPIPTK